MWREVEICSERYEREVVPMVGDLLTAPDLRDAAWLGRTGRRCKGGCRLAILNLNQRPLQGSSRAAFRDRFSVGFDGMAPGIAVLT